MKSHEPSCGIIPKTLDNADNTLFQYGPPIFSKINGDNFFL